MGLVQYLYVTGISGHHCMMVFKPLCHQHRSVIKALWPTTNNWVVFLSLCQKFALRFALAHMVNVPLVASAKNILLHSKCWLVETAIPLSFFFHSSSILFHKRFFLIQGSKRVHFPFQTPSIFSIFSKSFGPYTPTPRRLSDSNGFGACWWWWSWSTQRCGWSLARIMDTKRRRVCCSYGHG
jgi:hypothetical protein